MEIKTELKDLKRDLFDLEDRVELFKNRSEPDEYYTYLDIKRGIKDKIRDVFTIQDYTNNSDMPRNFWGLKRKAHQLGTRLDYYEQYHGEELRLKLRKERDLVLAFAESLPGTTSEDGHNKLSLLNTFYNKVSTLRLGKDLFDMLHKHRPKLVEQRKEYNLKLDNIKIAEKKAIDKLHHFIEMSGDNELGDNNMNQKHVAKAYYLIYKIKGEEPPKYQLAKFLKGETTFLAGYDRSYGCFLFILRERKEERVRNILWDMNVPADAIQMALDKNLFYATKLEALKDFGNVLKLMEAEDQAEVIRENIHLLGEANVSDINQSIKRYFKENELFELSEDEIKDLVAKKFGSHKSFSVSPRRSHWRTNWRTGMKDIRVCAHAMITFKLS